MGIVGAFVVPHPPIIVEEVGHRQEKAVETIVNAFGEIAREIATLKPDTIIMTSPHTELYSDYFHVAGGLKAEGDFGEFGAPKTRIGVEYDWEYTGELEQLFEEKEFPAGTLGEKNKRLDHGIMVPLYFIQKEYQDFKLVRIGLSGLSFETHYTMGEYLKEIAEKLGRRTVIVASGDLSHKLSDSGPYGYRKEGPEYDERIMKTLASGNFGELFEYSYEFCEKAGECGHRSFLIMAGALDGMTVQAKQLAHEGPFGVGYGICSYQVVGKEESRKFGTIRMQRLQEKWQEDKNSDRRGDEYTRLARQCLESYFQTRKPLSVPKDLSTTLTQEKAGAFVSLKKYGQLRGCIGTISPVTDCVAQEIIQNAISSAISDPRFPPVTKDELKEISISVDVLGKAEPISSKEELDVKRYGVIVSNGCRRGLLLPDLEGVDTIEEQIAIAKRKAGIGEEEEVVLQRFEVIRHTEGEA